MDYPHDSFETNPELYETAGWDESVYQLVQHWCFMDDRITADSFRYIADNSYEKAKDTDIGTIKMRWEQSKDIVVFRCKGLIWLIIICATIVLSLIRKKHSIMIISCLNLLGTLLLVLFQLYTGRLLYRSVVICFIPSTVLSLLLLIQIMPAMNRKIIIPLILTIVIGLSASEIYKDIIQTFDNGNKQVAITQSEKDKEVSDYAIAHKENIYIKEISLTSNVSPYIIYPKEKPENIFGWGGSEWGCKAHRIKWAKYDISYLNGEVFKRSDAFYISQFDLSNIDDQERFDKTEGMYFYIWLKEVVGVVAIHKVDTICDGAYVYQFVFDIDAYTNEVYDFTNGKVIKIF